MCGTWYDMCAEVIHMLEGGERQSLSKILHCYAT